MIVALQDANILIDLYNIDLLDELFDLDMEFFTSDFIQREAKKDNLDLKIQKLVSEQKLEIMTLSGSELTKLFQIKSESTRLSIPDCSAIVLAKKRDSIILTGDKPLRNRAKLENIEYHGVLWILDQMIDENILDYKQAIEKLNELREINARLPYRDVI